MTLCSEVDASLIGEDDRGGRVAITLHCKMRDCPNCASIYKARLAERIRGGQPNVFLTLHCNHDWFGSPDERAENMSKAWALTRDRAVRLGMALPFLAVFEEGKTGEPHLHIAMRLPDGFRIKWFRRWLRRVWRDLAGTSDVNVKPVDDLDKLARYLSKAPFLFAGRRRFWTSRTWVTITRSIGHLTLKIAGIVRASIDELEARLRDDGIAHQRVSRNRLQFMPP